MTMMPRSTRKTLEHYAAELALAHGTDNDGEGYHVCVYHPTRVATTEARIYPESGEPKNVPVCDECCDDIGAGL